jgi:hypothetical protein
MRQKDMRDKGVKGNEEEETFDVLDTSHEERGKKTKTFTENIKESYQPDECKV